MLATGLILHDQDATRTIDAWVAQSRNLKGRAIDLAANLLLETSTYCGLSVEGAATLVGQYGTILDETGYTARKGLPVRQILMYALTTYAEKIPRRDKPCDEIFVEGVANILAEE